MDDYQMTKNVRENVPRIASVPVSAALTVTLL
jgi:hypothetical protein